MNGPLNGRIENYRRLLRAASSGEIGLTDFELQFLTVFKAESEAFPEAVYEILNDLFCDTDCYCSDPDLRDEEDLDDEEFTEAIRVALNKLEAVRY